MDSLGEIYFPWHFEECVIWIINSSSLLENYNICVTLNRCFFFVVTNRKVLHCAIQRWIMVPSPRSEDGADRYWNSYRGGIHWLWQPHDILQRRKVSIVAYSIEHILRSSQLNATFINQSPILLACVASKKNGWMILGWALPSSFLTWSLFLATTNRCATHWPVFLNSQPRSLLS